MDRKALVCEYKESRCPIGSYQVRNRVNGKLLIDAGTDLPAVLNRHQAQLRFNIYSNRVL